MLGILREIESYKREETALNKRLIPLEVLMEQSGYKRKCISLAEKFKETSEPGIIAEFKRQSPSKGVIRVNADPKIITSAYRDAGAYAISVSTDKKFFGAQPTDFEGVRENINLPILRKDFILEEYQVHETKAMGADIMLLIAAILSPGEVEALSSLARSIGLDVLLELHSEKELKHYCDAVNLIGVNNRNLNSFNVDTDNSKKLAGLLPAEIPKIAESGLSSPSEILDLYNSGFSGFLIGETFMKSENPGEKCKELITDLKTALL